MQWLRDNLGIIQASTEIEALARTVADNGGVVHRAGVFRPLRAALECRRARLVGGLTRFANKGHIARAALEATAFQTREVLDAMDQGLPASPSRSCAPTAAWSSTSC